MPAKNRSDPAPTPLHILAPNKQCIFIWCKAATAMEEMENAAARRLKQQLTVSYSEYRQVEKSWLAARALVRVGWGVTRPTASLTPTAAAGLLWPHWAAKPKAHLLYFCSNTL